MHTLCVILIARHSQRFAALSAFSLYVLYARVSEIWVCNIIYKQFVSRSGCVQKPMWYKVESLCWIICLDVHVSSAACLTSTLPPHTRYLFFGFVFYATVSSLCQRIQPTIDGDTGCMYSIACSHKIHLVRILFLFFCSLFPFFPRRFLAFNNSKPVFVYVQNFIIHRKENTAAHSGKTILFHLRFIFHLFHSWPMAEHLCVCVCTSVMRWRCIMFALRPRLLAL